MSYRVPRAKALVRITGYGADRSRGDRNYAQQSHLGPIAQISDSVLYHQVDTMGATVEVLSFWKKSKKSLPSILMVVVGRIRSMLDFDQCPSALKAAIRIV